MKLFPGSAHEINALMYMMAALYQIYPFIFICTTVSTVYIVVCSWPQEAVDVVSFYLMLLMDGVILYRAPIQLLLYSLYC